MVSRLVFAALVCLGMQTAKASCEDCFVKNGMIIFQNQDPKNEIYLGWNFRGATDVDYEKMRVDEAYSSSIKHEVTEVANYLTDSEGRILASIPEVYPESPFGGIFRAAGWNPNHRSSETIEDNTQNFVYHSLDARWETIQILLFNKVKPENTLALQQIKSIDLKTVLDKYNSLLRTAAGNDKLYKRDRKHLATTFIFNQNAGFTCPANTLKLSFDVSSSVPKGSDTFEYDGVLALCLTINRETSTGKISFASIGKK